MIFKAICCVLAGGVCSLVIGAVFQPTGAAGFLVGALGPFVGYVIADLKGWADG